MSCFIPGSNTLHIALGRVVTATTAVLKNWRAMPTKADIGSRPTHTVSGVASTVVTADCRKFRREESKAVLLSMML